MQFGAINTNDFRDRQQSEVDKTLLVKFFCKPMQDQVATKEAGRPVFRDVEYVDIRVPGKKDAVCRPARARDIARFQQHYDLFKARTDAEPELEGTLLTEWPVISRSMAEEFSFFNVKTVEQLATISDSNVMQFMGGQNLKRQAGEWLEVVGSVDEGKELKARLAKQDAEIAELKAAVKAMQPHDAQAGPGPKVTKKKRTRKKATAKKE